MAQENKFEVEISAKTEGLEKALKTAQQDVNKAGEAAKKGTAGFSDFADALGMLNINFGGMGVNIGAMVKGVQSSIVAIKGATLATRGFSVALAATGIGAIVLALGALISAFTSTQKGTDMLRKVTLQFKYAMDGLFGVLQTKSIKAFDALKEAFSNPKQAVIDLWEAIKTNLLNRLQGVIDAVTSAGKTIQAAIRLEWDVATMEAKKFGEALLQAATGIDDLPGKLAKVVKEGADGAKAGIDAGARLAAIDKQILQYKLATTKELARQELIFKEQQRISRDTSLSAEAQLEAQNKAEAALKRMEQIEVGLLNLQVKREKITTETSETLDEQKVLIADMEAGIIKVNAKFAGMGKELDENKRRVQRLVEAINIDEGGFSLIPETPEEPMPDDFINFDKLKEEFALKFNELAQTAEYFTNALGSITEEGFNVLFDSAKGFDDFAEVIKNAFQRIIAQMAAAAIKAIALRAILSAFPGLGAAGAALPSFGQMFSQNAFGGGSGGFRISAGDLVSSSNFGNDQRFR